MPAADRPAADRWLVLSSAALGAFGATVMGTGVNVALPTLVRTFETDFAVVQWVVLSYLLATSALLPVLGRLADAFGKRRFFLAGFATFALGSLLCGLAPSAGALIALRTLQGLGSAVLTALGLAIVTDVFPASERGRAIGVNGAVLSAGIVIGPTLGGFLIDALSWRWVFWIGVPLGLAGLLLAWRVVPAGRGDRERGFDVAGAATLVVALTALSLALTFGQGRGFTDAAVLALFALAGAGLIAFPAIERRAVAPVLELSLLRNRELTIGLVAGLATFIAIAGTIFLMPFYLEKVLGYAPREVGLLMSVVPIVLVLTAPLAGILADRVGARPVTVAGLALILIGYLAIGTLDTETTALGFVLRFLPIGLGMGTFQTPNNSAVMGSVPRRRSGVAGGLLALTRTLGQTAGIAVLGSLWVARVAVRGGTGAGDATAADPLVQVAALGDMLLVVQIGIALALALCVWDLAVLHRAVRAGG